MHDPQAAARQSQFLQVLDRDTAEARFRAALQLSPRRAEAVPLEEAWGRVLAEDVVATVNVPSFDRSNVDGFALRAADTYGATENSPRRLRLNPEVIATAVVPQLEVESGTASPIATGGMLPRGADAVLMIEYADLEGPHELVIRRAVAAGGGVTYAGNDVAAGETVLRRGDVLTSRETGLLAAIGQTTVSVWQRPRVAIVSTGDEIIEPGTDMRPGMVYDSNARILCDAVRELGAEPWYLGIVNDQLETLINAIDRALAEADVVVLSGGTSKGAGDLSYLAVERLRDPGIVAHGVALKPGKPICLAATAGKPVVILPGFPTSAVFTFHEFVAPVILQLGGRPPHTRPTMRANLPLRVASEMGRTEYLLVNLVHAAGGDGQQFVAYPMGKGSGSVTTFSRADGFITIDRHCEFLEAGEEVEVRLLGSELRPADLVVIGSHCIGLDWLLGQLQQQGWQSKFLGVGSTAGLEAARRDQCDVAGIHLLDPASGQYNRHLIDDRLVLVPGYGRQQGLVFRRDDIRFQGVASVAEFLDRVAGDVSVLMVNRNQGSGTRVLLDSLLAGRQPPGHANQTRSHTAVATAVSQGRADWGLAIRSVADWHQLGFLPVADEQYDFVVPRSRLDRPPVRALMELLGSPVVRRQLGQMGLHGGITDVPSG
ncbi:MAG: molybdopterin biosynthesis protein [Pirellulales bacterium]